MRKLLAGAPVAAALWMLIAAPSPPLITASPIPTPSASATARPTPIPTPTPPSTGTLSLSVALGPPGTKVTVTGTGFRASEPVTVYWDSPDHPFGTQNADAQGSFKFDAEIPHGDPGQHVICPLEPNSPQGCAQFKLEAPAPSPSPSASATPTPSPAPTASAAPTPVIVPDAPAGGRPSAVAALLQPPFVIFPVLVLLALLGGCVYWIWVGTHRRPARIPAATVVHRSVRPGGGAETTPTPPTLAAPPVAEAPPTSPAPPPTPPAELPSPRPAADDTLDLPQPGD